MATSTTNYSFSLPEVGGDTDQWGTQLNANWTLADSTLKTIEDSVVDVTLTGNDYLTISGQAITVGDVDLTADVTGTLPVASGGTGLAALGSANQVLAVNSGGTALEYKTLSTGGTVTSVAVTGSDGIQIDSGSPVTTSGTIALGINSTTLSTHLGLGSLATQSTISESQISDLGSYITASSTDTLTNKSGNISQWTNDAGYLTAETNDLSNVSGTLAIANGGTGQTTAATARVALLPSLATNGSKLVAVNSGATDIEYIATSTLSITESQISDFGSYQPSDAGLTSIAGLTTAADKMIYTTAADTYAVTTLTSAGRALLDDADAAAQRITLGLGTAATSNTSAFEAAGSVSTHAALTEVHGISAFGATLVDDADAPAARTTLGLGTIATQDSDSIVVTGGTATLSALEISSSVSGSLIRVTSTGGVSRIQFETPTSDDMISVGAEGEQLVLRTDDAEIVFRTNENTERMRIDSSGAVCIGTTSPFSSQSGVTIGTPDDSGSSDEAGLWVSTNGFFYLSTSNSIGTRLTDTSPSAGTHNYIWFRYQNTVIGDIDTTDNTTIRYNTFTGGHWTQFEDGTQPTLFLGTVLSTVDDLLQWTEYEYTDENGKTQITTVAGFDPIGETKTIYIDEDGATAEGTALSHDTARRIAKCKVSDVAGDKCVYGVFAGHYKDGDSSVESLGLGIIRIGSGVTVKRGDLLESAGDGTARPQTGDFPDLFKAGTIAKVTSTTIVETYDDGSYTVACTLHCG